MKCKLVVVDDLKNKKTAQTQRASIIIITIIISIKYTQNAPHLDAHHARVRRRKEAYIYCDPPSKHSQREKDKNSCLQITSSCIIQQYVYTVVEEVVLVVDDCVEYRIIITTMFEGSHPIVLTSRSRAINGHAVCKGQGQEEKTSIPGTSSRLQDRKSGV